MAVASVLEMLQSSPVIFRIDPRGHIGAWRVFAVGQATRQPPVWGHRANGCCEIETYKSMFHFFFFAFFRLCTKVREFRRPAWTGSTQS